MTMLYSEIAAAEAVAHPAETAGALPRRRGLYRDGGKRLLDLVLVLLALPVVLPVVLVLAALVMTDGARPFYRQARLGRGGRTYMIWKLRTMVPDADARLAAHLAADPAAAAEWALTQKLRRDPRITPAGRLLRRSSLDELPQLLNVILGDMSLIGPRPMMVDQAPLYPGRAYYALRPGISGPWQVSERNATSFADRARFDDRYERDLSLGTDVRLILATFRAVARGTGC
jgi:lipopolysaccharide/colanic/teichoic acid biosynthesis glycosyltransferase